MLIDEGISAPLVARRERLRRRKALPSPVQRQEATQKTLDEFRGTAFSWEGGQHCVKLAHFHLRKMRRRVPALPRIRSVLGAKRVLKARGWGTVSGMLDAFLPRIAPAEMQLGDLAALEGDGGLDAVFLCVGPRRLFGWREDEPEAVVLEVAFDEIAGAWRV
jgi:hypothetical protein